jgi:hypothetical protein
MRTVWLWLILIVIPVAMTVTDWYTETPAQTKQRITALKGRKHICKAMAACAEYGKARQACATAGNFDTCMSVKLETVPQSCSADGKLQIFMCHGCRPAQLPNAFQCLVNDGAALFSLPASEIE